MTFLLGLRQWPGLLLLLSYASLSVASGSADYFVHSLPGLPQDSNLIMHAGEIEVNHEHNGNLFFWHFQNQHVADRQRTVIWFNGGPGCSSEDGALMEIGPFRLRDDHTLVPDNGSWNEFANLLFVDNPVGTGFSYVDTDSYVVELDDMAAQFVVFLEKWYALFPEYEQDDLYLSGESYAGQHIPYIAKHIMDRNNGPDVVHRWNLKGILIGNGWISPPEQYEAYLTYLYHRGLLVKTSDLGVKLDAEWAACRNELAQGEPRTNYAGCEVILQDFLRLTSIDAKSPTQCMNMYDVRLRDSYPDCGMNWPPDVHLMKPYLRRQDVVQALHVGSAHVSGWVECNGRVGRAFTTPKSRPSVQLLPGLLAAGVRVLLFSGDQDLICNHIGTEELIANLEWNGGRGFELAPGNLAPRRDWTFDGQPAGFWQDARNLTYVLFYNASHMVPFDYSRRTRDMLDRFMGVDISSIGGVPADSRLDGEKGLPTSVGGSGVGVPNTDLAEGGDGKSLPGQGVGGDTTVDQKLAQAEWHAYERSAEIVLFIVVFAAAVWGVHVWRGHHNQPHTGYEGLRHSPGDVATSAIITAAQVGRRARRAAGRGLDRLRGRGIRRDVVAADFGDGYLEEMHVVGPRDGDLSRYSVGGDSDEGEREVEGEHERANEREQRYGVANGEQKQQVVPGDQGNVRES